MTALHSEEYRRFVRLLVAARHDAQLTQRALAERLDVDPSFVAKYETCVRRLDFVEFLRIADALNVDSAAFITAYRKVSPS